jgi:hypothetical protein
MKNMDIKILRRKNELRGTCYIELLPGKYSGKCWNADSIFFDEEVFGLFEPAIGRHAQGYDHYAFNEVDKESWLGIITDLEGIQKLLEADVAPTELCQHLGFLFKDTKADFFANIDQNKKNTIQMIQEFVIWIKGNLVNNDPISILGI